MTERQTPHTPGAGCTCHAMAEHECVCKHPVDWRSAREVELERENSELKRQLTKAQDELCLHGIREYGN